MIEFTVPGEPKGKARPRFCKNGHVYTPKDTVNYEEDVTKAYQSQCGGVKYDKGIPLSMDIKAYFTIPKSVSKKKYAMMISGEIRPTKKPDMDNIVKIIADSLNKIAYYDDAQIVAATVEKYYSDVPRVVVRIREIGETKGT